ncbi:VanZ family protein [candidate division WOR-3 bacterium]|nr:VanZ family protein [candidate division WOR-3 bacterium]
MKRLPFLLWLIVIIGVTAFPLGAMPEVEVFGMDKLFHFFLFSVLILLLFFGFGKKSWKFLFLFIFFAAIDELCQYYVPGRFVSIYDLIFNLSGVGIAYWVLA